MKKNIAFSLSIIVFVAIYGFNELRSEDNITKGKVAMSLDIGNYWKMKTSYYIKSNPDSLFNVQYSESKIESKINFGDEVWYKTFGDRYMINRHNGLWGYKVEDGTFHPDSADLSVKFPTFVGDKWKMKDGTKLETISINKVFNNPAGKFSAIHYKISSPASEIDGDMYVVPFIGIVFLEMHNPFASAVSKDTVMVRLELIDFKLNN